MKHFFAGAVLCMVFLCPWKVYSSELWSWGLNLDGQIFDTTNQLPGTVDHSQFDWMTGLGDLSINLPSGSTGSHTIVSFFDHEIVNAASPFFDDEIGIVCGQPLPDQIWEIDEPGFAGGDIYQNFLSGRLDNSNGSTEPDDVSMAMGWTFFLEDNETAILRFLLSDTPDAGIFDSFYLSLYDPDSDSAVYFSGTLDIERTAVPEPSTLLLLSLGLAGLGAAGRGLKAPGDSS